VREKGEGRKLGAPRGTAWKARSTRRASEESGRCPRRPEHRGVCTAQEMMGALQGRMASLREGWSYEWGDGG